LGTDAAGEIFSVKGREIESAVLFADISEFSKRTNQLSSAETLAFVNLFFTWITAEALLDSCGIIDKYIGDGVVVVFSNEFGSKNAFIDALRAARRICECDVHAFQPHIGIACGKVTVGYVGTPAKYSCSVFGVPVTLASRFASVRGAGGGNGRIVFPANAWSDPDFEAVFPALKPDASISAREDPWTLQMARAVELKNVGIIEIRELEKMRPWESFEQSAEQTARETVAAAIKSTGRAECSANGASGRIRSQS